MSWSAEGLCGEKEARTISQLRRWRRSSSHSAHDSHSMDRTNSPFPFFPPLPPPPFRPTLYCSPHSSLHATSPTTAYTHHTQRQCRSLSRVRTDPSSPLLVETAFPLSPFFPPFPSPSFVVFSLSSPHLLTSFPFFLTALTGKTVRRSQRPVFVSTTDLFPFSLLFFPDHPRG